MSDVGIKHSKPTTEAERQQEESSRSRPGANLGPGSSSSSLRPSDFFSLSPFALMRRWTEEMDQVFSVPPVSVRERDGKWVVTVDLPGFVKEEVAVEIADQNLIIQGKRKREDEERQTAYQRPHETFYRVIPLPEGANADAASANFKNGILEVIIPIPPNQPLPESHDPVPPGYSIKDHTQLAEAWVASQLPVGDLERILDIATEAFGDRKKALQWLQEPNLQTGQKPPVMLIGTAAGFDVVETVLRQIQYGVIG